MTRAIRSGATDGDSHGGSTRKCCPTNNGGKCSRHCSDQASLRISEKYGSGFPKEGKLSCNSLRYPITAVLSSACEHESGKNPRTVVTGDAGWVRSRSPSITPSEPSSTRKLATASAASCGTEMERLSQD